MVRAHPTVPQVIVPEGKFETSKRSVRSNSAPAFEARAEIPMLISGILAKIFAPLLLRNFIARFQRHVALCVIRVRAYAGVPEPFHPTANVRPRSNLAAFRRHFCASTFSAGSRETRDQGMFRALWHQSPPPERRPTLRGPSEGGPVCAWGLWPPPGFELFSVPAKNYQRKIQSIISAARFGARWKCKKPFIHGP